MNHLTEVAELVAEATGGRDTDLVIAAVLHDVLEDTDATAEELTMRFGPRVARLVAELTDNKSLPKEERKRLQIEKAPMTTIDAKVIKLADKVANLRALTDSPPADWPRARRLEYVDWSRRVVARYGHVNSWLEMQFILAADQAAADAALSAH